MRKQDLIYTKNQRLFCLLFFFSYHKHFIWIGLPDGDKDDRLFHPSNLINGDIIKKYLQIHDGPHLGKLISYLSRELAFNRLKNFDEAIYKGKQWIQQNAPNVIKYTQLSFV